MIVFDGSENFDAAVTAVHAVEMKNQSELVHEEQRIKGRQENK